MKWSELPKEYQDLEKKFSSICYYEKDSKSNDINDRFRWLNTPQKHEFWWACYVAKSIADLPPITITDYPDIKQPEKKERYFIVFFNDFFNHNKSGLQPWKSLDGTFINHGFIKRWIAANMKISESDVMITDIKELSESDYNDFIA